MHELSIAEAVVGIVERHAAGRRVLRVDVRVGHLRQVVPSALEFAFELTTAGTPVEGAELVIEVVPAAGRCRTCGNESALLAFPLQCSHCAGFDLDVIRGQELLVDSLDLEEELATTGRMSNGGSN